MEIKNVALVLVDISGYTRFMQMHAATLLHAEEIITELMESVIDQADFPLTLNKLEGDAALLYAEIGKNPAAAARDVTQQVLGFFQAFKEKQTDLTAISDGGCPCYACQHIAELQLKAVLHHGEVVLKEIRHFQELAGNPVILIHRLLKNTITSGEYVLMTEDFYTLSGGVPGLSPQAHMETYLEIGDVQAQVFYPKTITVRLPEAKPMTRPKGVIEGQRLTIAGLWRRLTKGRPLFRHLSAE